ncbi:50S ribosomal protein L3 [archaeon]|jgi:large subunit ribosomal protein L3|nr:50S ribosomal protein L3 [archaeon]MBT3450729.1 50S ribosomal protein L3 [archaeon]MBT6869221.1 50S ribosomal protein L3 [archaeon]MBT7193757.1 50S ribosomal protein L3 [archaeon]MBT7381404.1 50S ribosomal protein L3 [archaeon]
MGKARNPRRGSMQFWPRKRSSHSLVRVRSWAKVSKAKPLGFIAHKAGMTHIMALDNGSKSMTKGEKIALPVTIFDCPPMFALGAVFYNKDSKGQLKKSNTLLTSEIPKDIKKNIERLITLSKKKGSVSEVTLDSFKELKLLVVSVPSLTSIGTKKPKILEIAIGGSKEEQLEYIKTNVGKEIKLDDVVNEISQVDVHSVTKGKGFQGVVKKFGVSLLSHKSEKSRRKIGNLGAWTPKRIHFSIAQCGKMGFHLRTEYNKLVLKIGTNPEDVNSKGGINKFGFVKNNYLLMKGSVAGPKKGTVLITDAIRPSKRIGRDSYEVTYISK